LSGAAAGAVDRAGAGDPGGEHDRDQRQLQATMVRDSAASPAATADRAVRRLVSICMTVNPLAVGIVKAWAELHGEALVGSGEATLR
jgi:hypothetical protein